MRALIVIGLLLIIATTTNAIRSQWVMQGHASSDALIEVRFALTQRNLDILQSTLLDVSDTLSPRYGQWWTIDAINSLIAPPKQHSELVVSFLRERGATDVTNHHDMVKLKASVEFIEGLLQTSLHFFSHKTKTSKIIIRAVGGYSIPAEINKYVDFVSGLFEFPSIRERPSQMVDYDSGVDGYVIPYVINSLYKIPDTFPVNANSSICLVEFQDDQSYSEEDLRSFSKQNSIPEIKVAHKVGPFSGSEPDAEATLDVQYGGAIAKNSSMWYWTVKDWMYEFATDFLATKNPPLVVSMSWGWPEPNQCDVGNCTGDETSLQYVERTNVEFQKIGLLGVTLLAASGDQGAPGDGNPDCSEKGKKALSTIFPGASPWVLSVGATQLTNSTDEIEDETEALPPICKDYTCATSTTEIVCSYPAALITTGGGFSDYSATPSYQASFVKDYLSAGVALPPATDFNKTNRGFPDVSALGHNYLIRLSNDFTQVDGTSCSTPVFAGIIALLNSYRLNNGKAPLGFVAPLLYQAYAADNSAFTDITSGDNKCTESCCAKVGYEAAKGWDPVTGLGTPNFEKLLAYVQTLP